MRRGFYTLVLFIFMVSLAFFTVCSLPSLCSCVYVCVIVYTVSKLCGKSGNPREIMTKSRNLVRNQEIRRNLEITKKSGNHGEIRWEIRKLRHLRNLVREVRPVAYPSGCSDFGLWLSATGNNSELSCCLLCSAICHLCSAACSDHTI